MGHYSSSESSVRVDFFKESGKWYATEAVDMNDFWSNDEKDWWPGRIQPFINKKVDGRYKGMWCVILDPYHPMGFPIMFRMD